MFENIFAISRFYSWWWAASFFTNNYSWKLFFIPASDIFICILLMVLQWRILMRISIKPLCIHFNARYFIPKYFLLWSSKNNKHFSNYDFRELIVAQNHFDRLELKFGIQKWSKSLTRQKFNWKSLIWNKLKYQWTSSRLKLSSCQI